MLGSVESDYQICTDQIVSRAPLVGCSIYNHYRNNLTEHEAVTLIPSTTTKVTTTANSVLMLIPFSIYCFQQQCYRTTCNGKKQESSSQEKRDE